MPAAAGLCAITALNMHDARGTCYTRLMNVKFSAKQIFQLNTTKRVIFANTDEQTSELHKAVEYVRTRDTKFEVSPEIFYPG